MKTINLRTFITSITTAVLLVAISVAQAKPAKPLLHGKHWMAITGKPLGASAGARIFYQGGNAVDASCAMLAATSTMWDVLSWGGETQALIYNPHTNEIIGINALGVAPTGATPEFFQEQGMLYPRVRSTRGRHAGHAGRPHGDARRIWLNESQGCFAACH